MTCSGEPPLSSPGRPFAGTADRLAAERCCSTLEACAPRALGVRPRGSSSNEFVLRTLGLSDGEEAYLALLSQLSMAPSLANGQFEALLERFRCAGGMHLVLVVVDPEPEPVLDPVLPLLQNTIPWVQRSITPPPFQEQLWPEEVERVERERAHALVKATEEAEAARMRRMGYRTKPKSKKQLAQADMDESLLKRQEAIISSMTPRERRNPKIIQASRKRRIATGSGTSVQDVNRLLKQHQQMAGMMKKVSKMGKKGKLPPGLADMAGMGGGGMPGMPGQMPGGFPGQTPGGGRLQLPPGFPKK